MKYDTAVFDLDGTLLNTLDDLADSVNFALEAGNFPTRSTDEIRGVVGSGIANLIRLSLPKGINLYTFEKTLKLFKENYWKNMKSKTVPYEGIVELLTALKSWGAKTAVVSNKFEAATKELCEHFFRGLIDVALGESDSLKRKPAPDSVLAVIRSLGAKSEKVVYIGDSGIDIETAKNAGVAFIGAAWGFKGKNFLRASGAETVIEHPSELLQYF
jgi:phosphoglycolate phosphatase